MKKYANEIYVVWEGEKGEEYMVATADAASLAMTDDTREVMLYKLVRRVKLKNRTVVE